MISIADFCKRHEACRDLREWALANCADIADAWQKLEPEWLVWLATRPGVLTDRELRLFAVFCARQVEHMLTDQRLRDAIEVAKKFAKGKTTSDELAAAWAAAWNAARAAAWNAASDAALSAAADAAAANFAAAAEAQHAAFGAAWAADRNATWSAAWDAARAAQADWLRANTTPNFEVEQ